MAKPASGLRFCFLSFRAESLADLSHRDEAEESVFHSKFSIQNSLFSLLLVLFCLVPCVFAKYSGGSGTAADPYRIANHSDLYALADDANDYNKCFIMTANIDLDPCLPGRRTLTAALIAPDTSTSSGYQGTRFTGTFDGNDCNILNLRINGKDYCGLFGYIYMDASVSNLGLENVNVTGVGYYVGSLVGMAYPFTGVTNCYAIGTVTGSGNYVGGLVGTIGHSGVLNCYAMVTVTGSYYVGGLLGETGGSVTNCYAAGTVRGNGVIGGLVGNANSANITTCFATGAVIGVDYVGGLVGGSYSDASVTNSYATGSVAGSSYVGGLAGRVDDATVTSCYATGAVSGNTNVGGLVGANLSGSVTNCFWDVETSDITISAGGMGLTTSQMQQALYFQANNWAGTTWTINEGYDYPHLAWENTGGEFITAPVVSMPGSGTAENPWLIESKDDFLLVCAGSFFWDNHYVLSTDIDLSGVTYMRGLIGYDGSNPFTGSFDANSHIISNLTIEGAGHLGLFGCIFPSGSVRNLGFEDVNIAGVGSYVGGLAGCNYGTVTNCYASVAVIGVDYVGGLVGYNSSNASIANSYATGSVSGGSYVGGLAGCAYSGTGVTNCYARGPVSGSSYVGGLVGGVDNATVTNSYATGAVTGNGNYIGGLVGYAASGSITNCFWDVETSGKTLSAGGMGLTTSQMHQAFYFAANNWAGPTWTIDDGHDYPHLAWENAPGEFITAPVVSMAGSGTVEDPWVIESKDDFLVVCAGSFFWNKHYVLNTDIDLSAITYIRGLIGYDASNPFTGSFDGAGHIITNLTIQGKDYLGLFGYIGSNASVSNLGLEDVNITGVGSCLGGLVGYKSSDASIANSYATGSVTGSSYVGGLAGYVSNGGVTNSCATGEVTGAGNYVGGLVGYVYGNGSVLNCYAAGAVTGNGDYVGGLLGYALIPSVTNSYAMEVVNGNRYVGGLAGFASSNVSNCYATGAVTGNGDYVGGIVGRANSASVTNCYATGTVRGGSYVGGLVGSASATVSNCYAAGDISGGNYVGGLMGYKSAGTVTSSFWDVNTSGTSDGVGNVNPDPNGVMGRTTTQMMTLSTFTGATWDFNNVWAICETTNYPRLQWQIPAADMLCPDGVSFVDYSYLAEHWLWTDYGDVNGLELSGDGKIAAEEFAILGNWWGQSACGDCGGADYTGDHDVDAEDLALLCDNWLVTDYGDVEGAELTGDGKVDFDDIQLFADQWLTAL